MPDARLPDGRFDAVALTSVNGARTLAARAELAALAGLPLYAVGKRTAAAAPPGFSAVHVAGGDGAALVELLREKLPRGARVLHVAGEERAVELPEALAPAGIAAELFVIYRRRRRPRRSRRRRVDAAQARRIDAAFHFSPAPPRPWPRWRRPRAPRRISATSRICASRPMWRRHWRPPAGRPASPQSRPRTACSRCSGGKSWGLPRGCGGDSARLSRGNKRRSGALSG